MRKRLNLTPNYVFKNKEVEKRENIKSQFEVLDNMSEETVKCFEYSVSFCHFVHFFFLNLLSLK